MFRLSQILKSLLKINISKGYSSDVYSLLQKFVDVLNCKDEDCIHAIRIDGINTKKDIDAYLNCVARKISCPNMNSFLSYFISEIVDNVEQHANVSIAYGFVCYEESLNHLFIGIADGGRTIYGSYVNAQKYLDEIGDNEANSLCYAQKGFSSKNLPDAESRGYGISTNTNIVVDGLSGAFAIVSGNAFLFKDSNNYSIYELPKEIEWPGTIILAEIPVTNKTIDLYKYIC